MIGRVNNKLLPGGELIINTQKKEVIKLPNTLEESIKNQEVDKYIENLPLEKINYLLKLIPQHG